MRALLYGFDGLLVDSEVAGLASWRALFERFGQALDTEHWMGEVAAGRPCMPVAQLEDALGRTLDWDDLEPKRLAHRAGLIVARPGVREHLNRARELGLPCAIVAGAPGPWIDEQLENTGLDRDLFAAIVSEAGKPSPDGYLKAIDALGVRAADALAFEDSPVGVAAAKAAGVRCVAVPNEVTAGLPLDAADQVLDSLADVTLDELILNRR
ncbi:MAG TPA: HAD-IA family hydrolase [Actinophytocola sp.]|jgi:beta-phosphoglucomutase-like phosphatase (HAD superfamily)|uniref:HAD family hydrolase n=1 Tax=Actinophytocola sp. TaxID=1872138 RepID=UPI002F92EEA2